MAEGYRRREKKRMRDSLYVAWHQAAWSRHDYKLPKWTDIEKQFVTTEIKTDKREQTQEEMLAALRILNAAYGGEVIEV